jgi:hypothetical protein
VAAGAAKVALVLGFDKLLLWVPRMPVSLVVVGFVVALIVVQTVAAFYRRSSRCDYEPGAPIGQSRANRCAAGHSGSAAFVGRGASHRAARKAVAGRPVRVRRLQTFRRRLQLPGAERLCGG